MRLYLIRHAESEHNVAQVYAGVTDSALTNHGMLQIEKLADYFRHQGVQFTRVFCSPLQRARVTADALKKDHDSKIVVPDLSEKDFGSLERKSWVSPPAAETRDGFVPTESHEDLSARAKKFLDDYLPPVLQEGEEGEAVAVVSHGVILSVLWRTLKQMCAPLSFSFGPRASLDSHPIIWSNTGYLELEIGMIPANDQDGTLAGSADLSASLSIKVLVINGRQHLVSLKRTRGIGSSKHDPKQRKMDAFFSTSSSPFKKDTKK
ncbi:uncharacterized protein GIQ15_02024 [Arthroderma uncinatum]|uniref:uncharacterized protein n=1 Tax=Arthroderma uncinatum TaxID=74035 RepID=UPI00144AA866|nr:uncharacterized protein GIQ15_02024 [Arthroderma uncinatum]KAF3482700.1 hypothetical protein GIQ15_02024 [Arthroderma uncinatum]